MSSDPSKKSRRQEASSAPAFSGTEEAWDVYRLLVENSYDLVGELDVNGEYVYVNPSYTAALGYPVGELLGKSAQELIHPQDREKAKREFKQLDGTTVLRFRHQNGAWKWLDCSFRQFTTPLGPRTALISRDISARREAEIKFEVLASLGSRLSGAKTQVEAARVVGEAAQVLCGWDAFSLDLYDSHLDLIRPVLMIDEIDGKKNEIFADYQSRAPSPFVRTVLQDGAQRILRKGNDFDPSLRPFGDISRASASLLFVPISEGGMRLGVVTVQSYRINAYSRADLKLLEVLAGHCAGTLGRIRAVDGLRESQARFEAFMENTPGAAWIKDEAGRYIYANHSIESLLAKKPGDIISKRDVDVLPTEVLSQVQSEDKHVRETGSPLRTEKSGLPNDPRRWFICKFPFVSSNGWFVGGLGFDITDQVQMQRSLRASEERFRTVFEASPVAIGFVRSGELLYTNLSYRRVFSRGPEIPDQGRKFLEDFSVSTRAELSRYFQRNELAAASLSPSEVRGLRNGGMEFPCIVQIVPVELHDGPAHLVFVADISEKRSLEAQLLQAQKMESIGRLAGGIAHDFANLLTVIQGHASRLERGLSNPAPSLDGIIRAAHKATELTRQLLAFSRKQTLQIVETDLNAVITQTARMLERVIGEDITLRLHLGAHLPLIQADQALIEQLIVNLAITSRDSMAAGGNLSIRTLYFGAGSNPELVNGWEKGAVTLLVEDNGHGIPREDLPQIFEPFFRTRTGTETALRLATVYGIVQQHAGKIDVQSDMGVGTRFRIAFQATALPAPPAPVPSAPLTREGECILIVEDSADLRSLLRQVLMDAGFQTLDAASHTAAVQLFESARDRVSLIIADVFLVDGNGRELVRALRKAKPSLKAILTTGYDPHQVRVNMGLEETERFLAKPFQTDELLQAVHALLHQPQ